MDIQWQIIAPVILLQLILVVIALVSLAKAEAVRGSKLLWVIIILFGSIIGSIVYFVAGRKEDGA